MIYYSCLRRLFYIGLISSISVALVHAEPLNLKQLKKEGIQNYNRKLYQKSQTNFITLVQHNPLNADDYKKLAYAAYYNKNYKLAAVAYRFYFELKKVKTPKDPTYSKVLEFIKNQADLKLKRVYRVRVEDGLHLIKDQKIFGKNQAFQHIQKLHQQKVIEPRLQRLHARFTKSVSSMMLTLINEWIHPQKEISPKQLQTILASLQEWQKSTWGDHEQAQIWVQGVKALLQFKTNPQALLDFTNAYKSSHVSIKMLQVIALHALERCEDAYLLSDALAQDHNVRTHELLFTLKGILAIECSKSEGLNSLVKVLTLPPIPLEKAAQAPFK